MTTYESSIHIISSPEEEIFNLVSDLSNFQKLRDVNIAEAEQIGNKLKDIQFEKDLLSFRVDGFGKMSMRIVEREPFKTIKFAGENTPISVNFWIQLKQVAESDTRMKLTLKADIPTMFKMMIDKRLKEGINTMADVIAKAVTLMSSVSQEEH